MTIALSLKVNEGLVLAADSASTIISRDEDGVAGVENVYDNANKVFNLRKGLPIGMVTWGLGGIGRASISFLAKDLRVRLSGEDKDCSDWKLDREHYSVSGVGERVCQLFFEERYKPAFEGFQPSDDFDLGFIVAGYSAGEDMAEEYEIAMSFRTDEGPLCSSPQPLQPKETTGITWRGQPDAVSRMINGFSYFLPHALQSNLGVPEEQIEPVIKVLQQALAAQLIVPAMPFQDAIDLTEWLVDLTIQYSRFSPGPPTVGGPIELAAITKHEGFKWVTRKHYYGRELNPPVSWEDR